MYDYLFINTKPLLFVAASIVILCLLAVELASYLFFTRPFARLTKVLKDILKFKYPWDSIALLAWLLLAILALLYLNNSSPVSSTFLSAGIALFFLGWLNRYQHQLPRKISERCRWIRPFLFNYSRFWDKLKFNDMRARLFGPWLEIVGISIISKSFIFFPAYFIFPVILGVAIIQRDKKLALIKPHIIRATYRDLLPRLGHILLFAGIPFAIAGIVGIFTRELTIFYADIETARSILFTLSQIEGGVGVLAITIIFVLTQLTASNYSIRISSILFRQSAFWIPLIILFGSITYNLLVVSRSFIMLPSNTDYFHSLIVDLSFILGIATACGIAYFIFKAPRMVSPEPIIANSLKSFNKEWLDTIKRDWCRPSFQLKLNVRYDPFIAIERILSKAVDSGDSITFIAGLILVRDHLHSPNTIDPHELPNYIVEIDAYLRHHFRSMVRTAAKNSDAYTLLQLIHFIEELGNPSPESITECDTFAFDFEEAPGELLLREIIQQSSPYQLTECITRGIHIVESRATNVIETLPKQIDTWLFNQTPTDPKLSEKEQRRLWDNDHRVENFERQYFEYLHSLGVKAADSKSIEIVRAVTISLQNIISSIIQHIDGYTMKAMIVRRAMWSLDAIMKASCNNNLSDAMSLSMLKYAAEHTDSDQDESVAWHLIYYVSDFLLLHAKSGLLDFMHVVDSAMVGLNISKKYTNPTIHLLKSMGESAKSLKNSAYYSDNKDLQLVYEEIIKRIKQVGSGEAKAPKQIWATAKSVLESLNGPERMT